MPPCRDCEAAVVKPAASLTGVAVVHLPPCPGCKAAGYLPTACRLENEVALAAALSWMQGGIHPTCCLSDGGRCRFSRLALDARRQSPYLSIATWRKKSSYLPPRCKCEAAVAQAATWIPRCRSRPTRRLAVDARRLSPNLRPGCPKAADTIPAAAAQRTKSPYLPSRHGCEAAVDLIAAADQRRSRTTCRLAVHERRLSPKLLPWSSLVAAVAFLPPCSGCEATVYTSAV